MWWKAIGAVVNICLEAPKAEIYVNSPLCFIPTHTHYIIFCKFGFLICEVGISTSDRAETIPIMLKIIQFSISWDLLIL